MGSFTRSIHLKHYLGLFFGSTVAIVSFLALTPPLLREVQAQSPVQDNRIVVLADVQEANEETGVITARGNVKVNYPARKLQATAAQAEYYTRENRLILSGNVYVLQDGNSIRAETMVYAIDEGRFVATPKPNQQVESIYIVPESSQPGSSVGATPN